MVSMRAITVRQPWAWAITHGGKDVENRTRNIAGAYRGPVAIHSGQQVADDCWDYDGAIDRIADILGRRPGVDDLTLGAVIAVVDLVDVHTHRRLVGCSYDGAAPIGSTRTHWCSLWAMREHCHLVLANPRPLPEPVPCKGRLGLWTLPGNVEAAVLAQIGA